MTFSPSFFCRVVIFFAYRNNKQNKWTSVRLSKLISNFFAWQSTLYFNRTILSWYYSTVDCTETIIHLIKISWKLAQFVYCFTTKKMEVEKLFYLIFICLLFKSILSAYVSDLSPDVDCKTLLANKAAERLEDSSLVSIIFSCCSLIPNSLFNRFSLFYIKIHNLLKYST